MKIAGMNPSIFFSKDRTMATPAIAAAARKSCARFCQRLSKKMPGFARHFSSF
jgi:hypothetical protein